MDFTLHRQDWCVYVSLQSPAVYVYSQPVYLYEGKERSKVLLPKGLLLLLFVDKHSGLTEQNRMAINNNKKIFFFLRRALKKNCAASQVTVRKNNCIQSLTIIFSDRDSYCGVVTVRNQNFIKYQIFINQRQAQAATTTVTVRKK